MASPSSSVQQARRALGDRLREIRIDADLSGRDLGRLAGWHSSKVSRIEYGKQAPSADDIRAWCLHCDAGNQLADLVATLRAVDGMYVEWRRLEQAGLRAVHAASMPLYERTRQFLVYQSLVVPGIFQTAEYATALLNAIAGFRGIPDDVEQAVKVRLDRQQLLDARDRRFNVVIEEAVLRYQVGDAAIMCGQLGHLIGVAALPSVRLGVIPFATSPRRMWAVEGFSIFDDRQVNVELLSARVTVTQPREIAVYTKAFSEIAKLAVYGSAARSIILAAVDVLGVE